MLRGFNVNLYMLYERLRDLLCIRRKILAAQSEIEVRDVESALAAEDDALCT